MAEIPYEYHPIDRSVIKPYFKKIFVYPLVQFFPESVSPNLITSISNGLMFVALAVSFYHEAIPFAPVIISILVYAYLIGDHLDGAQAKRTNRSSAFGEFMDHYLDTFNTGILSLIIHNIYNLSFLTIVIAITITYSLHAATIYRHNKTGFMVFEVFSSFEAVLISIAIILLSVQPAFFVLMVEENAFFPQFTNIDIALMSSSLLAYPSLVYTLLSLRVVFAGFLPFLIPLHLLGLEVLLFSSVDRHLLIILFSLINSVYMGYLMISRLTKTPIEYQYAIITFILAVAICQVVSFSVLISILLITIVAYFIFQIFQRGFKLQGRW